MKKLFKISMLGGGMFLQALAVESAEIPQRVTTIAKDSLAVSYLKGHTVWDYRYDVVTTGAVVITPQSGYKLRIYEIVASMESNTGGLCQIYFGGDGSTQPIFVLDAQAEAAQEQLYYREGAIDEVLYLTCPAGTTLNITYDEF